jgi:hypothetical protein
MKGFSDPESGKNLEKTATDAGVKFTTVIWENAGHAFMN